jgi:hypothetical protein
MQNFKFIINIHIKINGYHKCKRLQAKWENSHGKTVHPNYKTEVGRVHGKLP